MHKTGANPQSRKAMETNAITGGNANSSLLKEAAHLSKAFHQQIDQSSNLISLSRPDLSRTGYVRALSALASAHIPAEAAITLFFDTHSVAFDWECRKKSHLLLKDLQLLTQEKVDFSSLPALHINTLPELAGYLYVVEGSSLGGLHISRNIEKTLGIQAENGGAFFNAYGDQTLPRWRAVVAFIESVVAPNQTNQMHLAVRDAFAFFLTAIQQPTGRME
jgi:heme oxygenase (biliverdin-IX-beta and delta-forming)